MNSHCGLWAFYILFCLLFVNGEKNLPLLEPQSEPSPVPMSPEPHPMTSEPSPMPMSPEPHPMTSEPSPNPMAPEPHPEPMNPEPMHPMPMNPEPIHPMPMNPEPHPEPMNPEPIHPMPMNPEPHPEPGPMPMTPEPIHPMPMNPEPHPEPMNPEPIHPMPMNPEPHPEPGPMPMTPEPGPMPMTPEPYPAPVPGSLSAYVTLIRSLNKSDIENITRTMNCNITIIDMMWPENQLTATIAMGHYNLSHSPKEDMENCSVAFSLAITQLSKIPSNIVVSTNITNLNLTMESDDLWSCTVTLSVQDNAPSPKQTVVLYIIIGVITAVAIIVTIVLIVSINKGREDEDYRPIEEVDDTKYSKEPY